MSSNYTGDDTATQAPSPLPAKSAAPILVLPVDGDLLNVASIHQALKTLGDGIDALYDRVGWLDSANTWTGQQTLTNGGTALSAVGKIESTGSSVEAAGNVTAGGQVVASQYLRAATARSSATPGSGQSMAAGQVWKDTTCFAWALVQKDSGASTLSIIRSVNVASVTYVAAGKYRVTLQTAATNKIAPVAQLVTSTAYTQYIPKSTVTTSQFEVWTSSVDGNAFLAADISDLDYFIVQVFAG